jgi:hypothetical protein
MQLLAVTPAFLSVAFTQTLLRTLLSTIRSSSKGWVIFSDVFLIIIIIIIIAVIYFFI